MNLRQIGRIGERFALEHLLSLGYSLVSMNWTCYAGELDLVMLTSNMLVFVEVKYVRDTSLISPYDLFSKRKKRCLMRTIHKFLTEHSGYIENWRLDLVCISGESKPVCTHYVNVLTQ